MRKLVIVPVGIVLDLIVIGTGLHGLIDRAGSKISGDVAPSGHVEIVAVF